MYLNQNLIVYSNSKRKQTILTDQVNFAIALDMIKGSVDPGGLAMKHCKPASIGFPGKSNDAL